MRRPSKYTAVGKWCEYGERRFYARSLAEARYAAVLEMQRVAGTIDDWRYEPKKFVFPDRTRAPLFYLPDFAVTKGGATTYHEVKGRWESRDRERIRLMARYYPEETVVLVGAKLQPEDVARIEAARAVGLREQEKATRREAKKRRVA